MSNVDDIIIFYMSELIKRMREQCEPGSLLPRVPGYEANVSGNQKLPYIESLSQLSVVNGVSNAYHLDDRLQNAPEQSPDISSGFF